MIREMSQGYLDIKWRSWGFSPILSLLLRLCYSVCLDMQLQEGDGEMSSACVFPGV